MNPYQASDHARRRVLVLVREPDAALCPGCRGQTATVWMADGPLVVTVPAGRLPRLVEARPHRCAEGGVIP